MSLPSNEIRFLIAGGGTGGHIVPGIALAEHIRQAFPRANVLFVGGKGGIEEKLVPQAGFALETLPQGKLMGQKWSVRAKTLMGLPRSFGSALSLIRRFRPSIVFGVGGYASGPVVLVAAVANLPIVLLEQNAIPGRTNRLLSKFSTGIITAFSGADQFFPKKKVRNLGNPMRSQYIKGISSIREQKSPISATSPRILVLGGSQGSKPVNSCILDSLPLLLKNLPGVFIKHQTGQTDFERVRQAYESYDGRFEAFPFLPDLTEYYGWADIVICRSGAMTVSEVAYAGLPAIFVPYPYAADDHQWANCEPYVDAGAAIRYRQEELTGRVLADELHALFLNPSRLEKMSEKMISLSRPRCGEEIVEYINSLLGVS